ncbi:MULTISPECIES: hypothetical protein [Microbulbifer]|uniref:hypothetical protein n=1 Tax=Microbulbifer TaxID=48073 RepID=UPI001E49F82B|nr:MULTISPECIES: hypothetical protein [Microbulbifer]UHQ54072.1 hypothetical protein LVE68_11145 [Microbulbifer sp. YPW16]
MKYRFLCAGHRAWLMSDCQRAERSMLGWLEEGQGLLAQGSPERALAYFGCAFELAGFLLRGERHGSVRHFSECARCLLAAGWQLGERELCGWVTTVTRMRLLRGLPTGGGSQAAVSGRDTAASGGDSGGTPDGLLH